MALWTENPSLAYSNVSTNPVSEQCYSLEILNWQKIDVARSGQRGPVLKDWGSKGWISENQSKILMPKNIYNF